MSNTVQSPAIPLGDVSGVLKRAGVRLEVHGLHKGYDGHEVLKGIDFNVSPGEIFVIIGPSEKARGDSAGFGHRAAIDPVRRANQRVGSDFLGRGS